MSDELEPFRPIAPVGDDFEVEATEPAPKKKVSARGAAIVGVRVVAGTVGLAVALAAIAGATFLPIPSVTTRPASVTVTPVPTAQQLVCPGALLRLGDEIGESATTSSAIGAPSLRYGSTAGGDDVTTTQFEQSDAGTGSSSSAPVQIGSTLGADDVIVSGAQSQGPDTGDFAGLATADCAAVATETWLVGGATSVGRTTLITLANPSDTISTVTLGISAESGAVSAPGVTGIVVQPHGQRVLPLAGFAPDVESPVVHVTSRGGQIVANLQQATVRGIEPGGVDFVGAAGLPSTSQVIPGVRVANTVALQSRLGEEGFGDLATVLRVFVPGDTATTAQVTVSSEGGATAGTSFSVELAAGTVEDLALDGLTDGLYTVRVATTEPIVSGVRVSTVAAAVVDEAGTPTAGGTDFAWLSAASPLGAEAAVTIAPGPAPRVHFDNPTDSDVTVTMSAEGRDDVEVAVAANGDTSVSVDGSVSYELRGTGRLFASVSYAGDAQISGYAVHAPAAGVEPITIFP